MTKLLANTPKGSAASLQASAVNKPRTLGPVVQRKVGFEFETDWLLKGPPNSLGMHNHVVDGNGWYVIPDRVDVKPSEHAALGITHQLPAHGEMELVTDAFEEDDIAGLDAALSAMTAWAQQLERTPAGKDTPIGKTLGGVEEVGWGDNFKPKQPDAARRLIFQQEATRKTPAYKQSYQAQHGVEPSDLDANTDLLAQEEEQYMARERDTKELWRKQVVVRSTGPMMSAPQMTGGIRLDRLANLLDDMSEGQIRDRRFEPNPAVQKELHNDNPSDMVSLWVIVQFARARAHQRAQEIQQERLAQQRADDDGMAPAPVDDSLAPADEFNEEVYAGALSLIGLYLNLASITNRKLAYDKALSPLLSRTNLGAFPAWLRNYEHFIPDALHAAAIHRKDDKAAPAESWMELSDQERVAKAAETTLFGKLSEMHPGLTIATWLEGIKGGNDALTWGQDGSDRWNPQTVGPTGNRGVGHVFEFRSLNKPLPLAEWRPFALHLMQYVSKINAGGRGYTSGRVPPPPPASSGKQDKDCFLTTACVETLGLPDDCLELRVLRTFRDSYMRALPNGPELIAEYYRIAPPIIAAIDRQPDAPRIYADLYERLVLRSVRLILTDQDPEAMANYLAIVLELKNRYLDQAPAEEREYATA